MSALSWTILGRMTGGSSGEHHVNFKPVDTSKTKDALKAAETACQLVIQQIPQQIPEEVEVSHELLRYPEGGSDAVTIMERDMEELQPEKFLGDTIVDFYIKYLESRLSPEHGKRFYFFNSFFFRKLLQSSAPTRIDPCKVDYEQLRRWTEEVNLFEKDYVFIPILKSSHWSLVIMCNLGSLTRAPDEMTRFPCIVHLDPIEGQHESFEDLIRSYVSQAWMERFLPSTDKDQFLALYQMKYVQAEVPQQENSHDCGLYVLHYIESFLVDSTLPDFSFASSERGPHFICPHFATEVLSKRRRIQKLIVELRDISQERARKCKAMKNLLQELLQTSQKLRACLQDEGYSEACIQDVLIASPIISNGQGCEIKHASIHEDSIYAQHHQFSWMSMGNNEPWIGPQIGPAVYENRSESLSPKQQHGEPEVQIVGPTSFNGPISEAMHASTHEDARNVHYQPSCGISRLDYEPLDDFELRHVEYERPTQSSESEEKLWSEWAKALMGKSKRGRNMTKEETRELLSCKVEGGRFCKGSGGAAHWKLISEEIEKKLGSLPSADQCRLRYDTLMKAYKTYKKYCMKTGKTFSDITEEERLDLKLATTLSEEWYTTMDEICTQGKSQKRVKLSSNACSDLQPLSLYDSPAPNPPPISQGWSFDDEVVVLDSVCGTVEVALRNVIPASVFSSWNEDLQSTLLNLVQECSWSSLHPKELAGRVFYLEIACRRLAILQDREPRDILNYVLKLWQLKLVRVVDMDFEEGKDLAHIDLWEGKTWFFELGLYEEISKKVLRKNPHLKTYCTSFCIEQSSLQYIRVLRLLGCGELEHLDLSELPSLRSLAIRNSPHLNLVTGWEVATGLMSIEISCCDAYHDFPNVEYLSSLREFEIITPRFNKFPWQLSQFSQCAKLRRLKMLGDESLSKVADLENLKELKSLEFLSLGSFTFSSIRGLSGLQALTGLHLRCCTRLRRVPDLGCLKRLTHLNMCHSSIEDIQGVEELHLLTSLDLFSCASLEWLPFLGNLKALVYLDLRKTGVKEIPGKEDLISLKSPYW